MMNTLREMKIEIHSFSRLTVDSQPNVDHQQGNGEHCQADCDHFLFHSGFTAHHGHRHYKEQQWISTGAPTRHCGALL